MKLNNDEIVAILERRLEQARDAGPQQDDWRKALDYYYGRPRGDEIAGQPQVQSLDVADMVHAVQAQLLPAFTGDQVCSFEPDGPQDDAQARLETDATNRVLMESSRGYVVFYEAVKDALLLKCGIVKTWLDETEDSFTVSYGELTPEQLRYVRLPQDGEDIEEQYTDDGYSMRRTRKQRRIRLQAVDPLNFVVDAQADCILLSDARLVAERKCLTRGELLEMGFKRSDVDRVPLHGDPAAGAAQNSRYRASVQPPADTSTWAGEECEVWEIYARLDCEGKDQEQLYRFLLGGQVLLLKEPADVIPYAAGAPFLEPHRFWGISLYDRLKTVQDAKTLGLRQWLANLANGNVTRTLANEAVNMDDLTNGRVGGVVRIRGSGPVAEAAMPFPYADTGASNANFLTYMDQVRSDRGGAALQMASAESQVTQSAIGSQGVDRIFSVQEQLAGMIARTLAETLLRSAFMLVHRLLRTEYAQPLTLRLADQWVQTDPRTWRPRDRVNIRHGLSPGEKARKAAAMQGVVQLQMQALQLGADGVLITLPNLYNAMLDWAAASEIDAPEKYWQDPAGQAAQQTAAQKGQQAQQQQQMQQQLMQVQLQMETQRLQLEQQKLQLEQYQHDSELRFKYADAALSAEVEEAKLVGGITADLAKSQADARAAAAGGANGAGSGGRAGPA